MDFKATEQALQMGLEELFAKSDKQISTIRTQLLLELANVDVSSKRLQKILAMFEPESEVTIRGMQQSLREIWDRSVPLSRKQELVNLWLVAATTRAGRAGLNALLGRGRLEFDLESLPGQVVMEILENWQKFQICANPDCPQRYFFAKRKHRSYARKVIACATYNGAGSSSTGIARGNFANRKGAVQ